MLPTPKNLDQIWLVIDARTASSGIASGISRFVTGITCALASELDLKQKAQNNLFANLKIMIISKTDPADWIVQLVYKYPQVVCYWSGDVKGLFHRKMDKPTWLWPTLVLKKLQNMTGNKIIWFAPANFDRPLFISNKAMASRVIQVVHDSIPFLKIKGFGFFFKRQFRFLVTRSLIKLPYVATVSQHSANNLNFLVKKRSNPLQIISDAVDEVFGSKGKIYKKEMLENEKKTFLKELSPEFDMENIFFNSWVIGVGRAQKYKGWDIAAQAIEKLNSIEQEKNIWFIRIGPDSKEISLYTKKSPMKEIGKIKVFEGLNILILPPLSDNQLAKLYSISDLLVHPSLAEGFGLPPLEAALSGLPVLYKKGTAIDDHFVEGALPDNYWNSLDSEYPAVWANQIERILLDKKDSRFFKGLYECNETRSYILKFSKSEKTFKWEDSANSLLDIIGSNGGIIETLEQK